MPPQVTRLAPSPTGALHVGNARTFVVNWVLARQRGWRVVLRIEDLDTPRTKPDADRQAMEDLRWLGLDWDEGPYTQRADLGVYAQAMESLRLGRHVYPCRCTRREIELAASAPHAEHDARYPGTCRPAMPDHPHGPMGTDEAAIAWRLRVPDEPVVFLDQFRGPQRVNVQQEVGDFVVVSKAMQPAYQLAVVVDDARQGVTQVVRGDDLITSAARQMWVYRFLGLTPLPGYWHVPLVVGPDGRRLAKRHGDTRLAWYREQGVSPQRLLGALAMGSGVSRELREMSLDEWLHTFRIDHLPREPFVFTQALHRWLLGDGPAAAPHL